ncbi:hypothetical protein LRS03_20285 [Rhizobacter sp. J219]|jgi:hypothetical protein|uniref:hypothetical protein n=1 Tax=Rhizobacter sp. J219 TaxID=2898430 RepID=UPI002150B7B3|nr:hypothetical protein [Rhizobacter sp. J219]MCR5885072.1 hypothetical protein [Rhizobacter sp. J219]
MSPAARSLQAFGFYLCVLGPGLLVAPGPLLAPFGIAAPQEVWVRVAGLLALVIGAYYLVAARHEFVPLMQASVVARFGVLVVFTGLVLGAGAPLALIAFGLVDAAAAVWTALALRRSHGVGANPRTIGVPTR